jgi:hypothetical protein
MPACAVPKNAEGWLGKKKNNIFQATFFFFIFRRLQSLAVLLKDKLECKPGLEGGPEAGNVGEDEESTYNFRAGVLSGNPSKG